MTPDPKRPLIVLLASHWLSMLGVALATTAGFSWLFVLPQHLRGNAGNPYIGILIFLVIPALLFAGLALIPLGILLARRKVERGLSAVPDRQTAWRRIGIFLALMTFVNLLIGSQATYRAVKHMETDQFCGQSCHVMKPEFTAWKHAPHSHVECVECHIAPGASGWFASKMSGTRQLMAVVLNNYTRPIESAMQTNRLVRSEETCEHCHARDREIGSVMKVIPAFADDERNTRSETVLMMLVGGKASGIHGAHMGAGIEIRYAPADPKRNTIPWVEYRAADGKVSTYLAGGAKAGDMASLPRYTMQCVDCHNRPAHSFELAARAVDDALAAGRLPVTFPFMRKTAVDLLTHSETGADIPSKLAAFYRDKNLGTGAASMQETAKVLVDIYNRNVFPDLKVTWGTYANNLGHTSAPGCFRCHDGAHARADKATITQDCDTCHHLVAVDEASPAVLKTLGQ